MFYFKRKIIIFVFLLCTISCASNPNNLSEVGKNFILIEKPSVKKVRKTQEARRRMRKLARKIDQD